MKKIIITIGRQYGSGGKEIGEKMSSILNIPCYDKELIAQAAKNTDLHENIAENINETSAPPSLLYTLSTGGFALGGQYTQLDTPINDRLYLAQSEIIRGYAEKGSCIIVGRCADYILRERDDIMSFYIYAPIEKRIKRILDLYDITEKEARNMVAKTDKKRSTYYRYYTDRKWNNIENYHCTTDSSCLGIDNTAKSLAQMVVCRAT